MSSVMENTEVYQRSGHTLEDYDLGDDNDISYSSGSDNDNDSDYGADQEDNDEYQENRFVLKDPGPFRHNRKMFMVSLPCAVMVLTLVGEIFLIAASFGAGVIIILDPKGEKKRCLILFTLLFVFCHTYSMYSILPMLWLSIFNIFLIGVINMYVILTGGLCVLQFTYFRKHEQKLALVIEKMLFSVYPWCCVILLTWATSSLISLELVPYVLLAYGFIYLQMFMTPHTTSFKVQVEEDEVLNVLPEAISLAMAIIYCMLPSMIHLVLHLIHNPIRNLVTFTVLLHLVFIFCLSVFLTTMMSLRNVCEFAGWPYKVIQYGRWIGGAICTLLIYPILIHYKLSSHFLPWLPAGVAIFAVYGALLSDKKFKTVSLLCLPLPCILFAYWLGLLPWKIVFQMLFGIEMTWLYSLLFVNCVVCVLCAYGSTYWADNVFDALLVLESTVFTLCEVLLYSGDLYPRSFLIITAAVILYTFHRLHTSGKTSAACTIICSSIHVTKALTVLIYHMVGTDVNLSIYRCVTLFILSAVFIRIISMDTRVDHPAKESFINIAAMSVAIIMNTKPILHIMCIYVLWEEPTPTDIMGLCIATCGVGTIVIGSLHLPAESVTAVRQVGVVAGSMGVLILVLQPDIAVSKSALLQWGDVGSVILVAYVLLTDRMQTVRQLFVCAAIAGCCPGIRMATLMYNYVDDIPVWLVIGRSVLYIPACICLVALLFIFFKFELVGKMLEKCILYLCCCLGVLSTLLLFLDVGNRDKNETVMSLPAWKLSLVTTGVVSFSLKILSTTQDLLIPLVEEKQEKEVPRLPFIGNITSILTFILACIQSPFRGLLQDIWCCAAALILLCLQKDKRILTNIKQENQIVPTMFTCIAVLYCSGIVHSDLWSAYSLSFLRSLVEISTMLAALPMFYILWGILWKSSIIMSEQVAVFLLPMNAIYLLYGSTYTSQALGIVGLFSGLWMMGNKLPLIPHQPSGR